MTAWLPREWCLSFVLALGHFLWQGTLIAVGLAIVLRVKQSVGRQYGLSLAALLLMAACPLATFGWLLRPVLSSSNVAVLPSARDEPAVNQPLIAVPAASGSAETGQVVGLPVMLPDVPSSVPLDVDSVALAPPPTPAIDPRWWEQFAPQLMATYLCGVTLMLLRLVFGLWGGRRLQRRVHFIDDPCLLNAMRRQATALGLKLLPVLAYCEQVTVPTVVGVLKPMILLPFTLTSGLSLEQIESVLAHELAHLRRYDHLVNLLQREIESLLFFHPAMWWVSHRVREVREHCCDDLVVACGAMPLDYANSLLVVAELGCTSPLGRSLAAVSLLATGHQKPSNLRQRIARLLGESAAPSLRLSPRLLLLTIAVPLIALIVAIQSGVSNPPAETSGVFDPRATAAYEEQNGARTPPHPEHVGQAAADWGEVSNGLRARVVPVLASMNEDAIDLAQRVTAFDTLEDVAFAVEIENTSDNPIAVAELRYGTDYGDASGKLASDWFGQFLYSIDYFDAAGKPDERPELIPVDKAFGISDGALKTTLAPKQSLKMLLRPNRWISVLSQQPMIGKQRAVVKYRGVFTGKETNKEFAAIAPAVEFTVQKRGYRPSGIPAAQLGDDPKNDPELEPDISKQLVWGEPVNGLRAALNVLPVSRLQGYSHGTKPKITLLVQNVGDKPVSLASLMWLSELPVKAKNAKGDDVAISSTWYTGITPVVRVLLRPRQIVTFDAGNLGLAVTKERAERFEHVTHRTMVAPSGKYTLQATERFGTSFLLKDGNENVLAPSDDDIKAELTTGAAQLDISNEVIECEIVDAVTGKLVSDTTTSFIIVKPKSNDADETVVSHMVWGPKGPGRIYFTIPMIPDDIAQRADRDELEVRWGTGNNPDYEDYWPADRVPLKQFFHTGPKSASETLSKIKLTPKKKLTATSPPYGQRAGRESPDPALGPTAGFPNSHQDNNPPTNTNADLRFNPEDRSADPLEKYGSQLALSWVHDGDHRTPGRTIQVVVLKDGTVIAAGDGNRNRDCQIKLSPEQLADLLQDLDESDQCFNLTADSQHFIEWGENYNGWDRTADWYHVRRGEKELHVGCIYGWESGAENRIPGAVISGKIMTRLNRLISLTRAGGWEEVERLLPAANAALQQTYPKLPPLTVADFSSSERFLYPARSIAFDKKNSGDGSYGVELEQREDGVVHPITVWNGKDRRDVEKPPIVRGLDLAKVPFTTEWKEIEKLRVKTEKGYEYKPEYRVYELEAETWVCHLPDENQFYIEVGNNQRRRKLYGPIEGDSLKLLGPLPVPDKPARSSPQNSPTQVSTTNASKSGDLEFLNQYPKLQSLSLDMTEPQFLEIVKQQELKISWTVGS